MNLSQPSSYTNFNYTEVRVKSVTQRSWLVYRFGECIDIVWFDASRDAKQVRDELVYQNNYFVDIEVKQLP